MIVGPLLLRLRLQGRLLPMGRLVPLGKQMRRLSLCISGSSGHTVQRLEGEDCSQARSITFWAMTHRSGTQTSLRMTASATLASTPESTSNTMVKEAD